MTQIALVIDNIHSAASGKELAKLVVFTTLLTKKQFSVKAPCANSSPPGQKKSAWPGNKKRTKHLALRLQLRDATLVFLLLHFTGCPAGSRIFA